MAYSNRRNTGGYRVSGRDMLSYGYKYGEPWAENKRALERAFREAEHSHGKSRGAWPTPVATHERRGYNPTGSYRGDEGQHEGGMEVVRVGGHFPSSSGSHGQQYPLPKPTAAARALSLNRRDIYDHRKTARTFVGGGNGWEICDNPHMGQGSRGLTAQMPPLSAYPPFLCATWRSESTYGEDHCDRNASKSGPRPEEEDMVYGSGPATMYSPRPDRHWRRGEYGSHGHRHRPATGYAHNGSVLFSDYDSEDPGSGSESRYSGSGYVESSYFDSDYGEETEAYLSDGESYDSHVMEGTYDDKSSEGVYSGWSDSEYWISDDEGLGRDVSEDMTCMSD